ncbi:MAG: hypothetical protein ACTHYM_09735 [Actinomycetaceae bacterium]
MDTALLVLAVLFLLAGAAGAFLAARLPDPNRPAVAERRRRLLMRLAIPSFLIAVVLIVLRQVA